MTQEDMPNVREIMDKFFEAGYRDAIEMACSYLYTKTKMSGTEINRFRKVMEEHLCKGI